MQAGVKYFGERKYASVAANPWWPSIVTYIHWGSQQHHSSVPSFVRSGLFRDVANPPAYIRSRIFRKSALSANKINYHTFPTSAAHGHHEKRPYPQIQPLLDALQVA